MSTLAGWVNLVLMLLNAFLLTLQCFDSTAAQTVVLILGPFYDKEIAIGPCSKCAHKGQRDGSFRGTESVSQYSHWPVHMSL